MNVLVIGKGGREHTIAWKLAQSPLVSRIYVAPGSDGIGESHSLITIIDIAESDNDRLLSFAKEKNVDLVVVGPETVLINGLADLFRQHGIPIFGPDKAAAAIEGSKQFAKELMLNYDIPTAGFTLFDHYESALEYVKSTGVPVVIKYDGLAAGKGVVVAYSLKEADQALKEMLLDKKFGDGKVVIEEFLEGPEFSLMALVNGELVVPLAIAQDHKRAYDGDQGPNTGGMGAYSPVSVIPDKVVVEAVEKIMKPTARAMVKEGRPFIGVLYGGLMLTQAGPKVIEFNARFGDPETEVVLPKMKSDLLQHILDVLAGKDTKIEWYPEAFLGVVLASKGYPESSVKGAVIQGLDKIDATVFHMGTSFENGTWHTNGGRVLFVLGQGETIDKARKNAYDAVRKIESDALFYRQDIGYQSK